MKEPRGSPPASGDLSPEESVEESGQGLAEYALILALVVTGAVFFLGALGQAIVNLPSWTLP